MREPDTGEYCCFLYVSYSETYRQIVAIQVNNSMWSKFSLDSSSYCKLSRLAQQSEKLGKYITEPTPPPTTPYVPPRTVRPSYRHGYSNRGQASGRQYSPIDEIIEEAVEHDIESELGKRLNITLVCYKNKSRGI